MLDISIIKLLLKRLNYNKYYNIVINIKTEKEIYNILLTINKYYEDFVEHFYLSVDELEFFFFSLYPSQKQNKTFQQIFGRLRELEISDSLAADIVEKYLEKDTATQIVDVLLPVLQGEAQSVILQVPEIIEQYRHRSKLIEPDVSPFIQDSLEDLMVLIDKDKGLHWSLKHLNENIGPLPGCTLGHVFARPESGKTTFIASQATHFLSQIVDQKVIWFCNEEDGKLIKLRTYQSLLNLSTEEVKLRIQSGEKDQLDYEYLERGGSRLCIHYDANLTVEAMRSILEKTDNTRVMFIDIADHVTFRGDSEYSGTNRLGELYRKFRGMASKYNCDIITVGQASAECDGKKTLHLEHMHNSKTDKPGALDYAIGLGKTYAEDETNIRYFNICKNKIGCTLKEMQSARIDKLRGRFYDI